MKKIFTLILCLSALLTSYAGNVELLFGESADALTPVADGAVLKVGYVSEDVIPNVITRYIQNSNLYVKVAKGVNITVAVEATKALQVCSIDGQCEAGTNVTKSGVVSEKMQPVAGTTDVYDLKIDVATTNKSEVSEITAKISVYDTANPSDKVTVTVEMLAVPQSEIGSVEGLGTEEYIRVAQGGTLAYSFNQPTRAQIINIAGRTIFNGTLNGHGTLAVKLTKGLYIYRAGRQTGKLLVK